MRAQEPNADGFEEFILAGLDDPPAFLSAPVSSPVLQSWRRLKNQLVQ
jgi:hypothetical protein